MAEGKFLVRVIHAEAIPILNDDKRPTKFKCFVSFPNGKKSETKVEEGSNILFEKD